MNGDGKVVLTGYDSGSLSRGALTSAGSDDVFVVALSASDGRYSWSRSLEGPLQDRGFGLAMSPTGGLAVVGYFNGTADFGGVELTSAGGTDVFVSLRGR